MSAKYKQILENALKRHNIAPDNTPDLSNIPGPIRLGTLLDQAKSAATPQIQTIRSFGPYTLDTQAHALTIAKKKIRLTEKETALLSALHQASGKSLSRTALLDKVWDYAESAETHTLETHIYRLRQKIETDPANPQIVLTEEDGYKLGF